MENSGTTDSVIENIGAGLEINSMKLSDGKTYTLCDTAAREKLTEAIYNKTYNATSLDLLFDSGRYWIPPAGAPVAHKNYGILRVENMGNGAILQTFYEYINATTMSVLCRMYANGMWTDWIKLSN